MPDTSERMAQSDGQHSGKIHQSPMSSVSFALKPGVCSSPELELQNLSFSKRSLYAACRSGQMFYVTAHGSKRQKANAAKLSLKFQPEQSHFCHILLSIARQREPRFQGNGTTQRTEQLKGSSYRNIQITCFYMIYPSWPHRSIWITMLPHLLPKLKGRRLLHAIPCLFLNQLAPGRSASQLEIRCTMTQWCHRMLVLRLLHRYRSTSPSPYITNSLIALQRLKGTIHAELSSSTPPIHRTLVETISNCHGRLLIM